MEKISRSEFEQLVAYMKDQYGIDLGQKLALVEGRLWNVIQQKGFSTLGEYFQYVVSDTSGAEAGTLISRLTTNFTYFYREEQHYRFLSETVLPALTGSIRDKDLRTWCAGCSSGDEPYTVAMVMDSYFGRNKAFWDAKILATDISPTALNLAREAIYREESLKIIPSDWLSKYFVREGSQYRVSHAIREEVVLRHFNLMQKTLPFKKKFHIIFCRNVMIYFDKQTRLDLVHRFYDALENGGYFFIGMSETLAKGETPFAFVKPSIYKKESIKTIGH
ncbi:MAG: protein-glutamate O-methyltransferase CheR [Oscillospiraceae bacterium]|nr:protein-glutamate O-methyltransferase CheR [Oscillospiraceae bacterium]